MDLDGVSNYIEAGRAVLLAAQKKGLAHSAHGSNTAASG